LAYFMDTRQVALPQSRSKRPAVAVIQVARDPNRRSLCSQSCARIIFSAKMFSRHRRDLAERLKQPIYRLIPTDQNLSFGSV
jgi:hypothetical protein